MFSKSILFIISMVFYQWVDAQSCADSNTIICSSMSLLCGNTYYQSYMNQNCPVTCKICIPANAPATSLSPTQCVDNAFFGCSYSAYLCNNTLSESLMKQYCPKTCGFCNTISLDITNGLSTTTTTATSNGI
uniref:ShKT domain-containing protein n=1 Tax=Acrobeloides nanus TaxID=290746 RepID=A0A914DVD2_9BILA